MAEGEGVRARGLNGKLCTDLRLWGDLSEVDADFLCLTTCKELGLPKWAAAATAEAAAGEFGTLEPGELLLELVAWDESGDQGTATGGDRTDLCNEGLPSPEEADRLRLLREAGPK